MTNPGRRRGRSGILRLLVLYLVAAPVLCDASPASMRVTSPDFHDGGRIPARCTCDGENTNPTLRIAGAPASARSMALIVDDPDAPSGTFTHWLVWNINPRLKEIAGVPKGAIEGRNDFGKIGYGGPCPPSGVHRYFFKIYALDTILDLDAGADRRALDAAMRGHVAAQGMLLGTYER